MRDLTTRNIVVLREIHEGWQFMLEDDVMEGLIELYTVTLTLSLSLC